MTDRSGNEWFGLHERLDTPRLRRLLDRHGLGELAQWSGALSVEDVAPALAAHLASLFSRMTLALRERDRTAWQAAIDELRRALEAGGHPFGNLADELPTPPFRQLLAVSSPEERIVGTGRPVRPDVPLAACALLTGAGRSPSLVSQLAKELASADRADWLVSFIKWSGIVGLRDALRRFTENPAPDTSPRLRIATTSYLGATDTRAIEFLLGLPNTEVRVSYDTHRTRLHAKAYLFHRATGFGSAYIGSANVSRVALDEGLEWTAKISQNELPHLWRQVATAFDAHWEDPGEFEPLGRGDLARFSRAIESERTHPSTSAPDTAFPFFELRPYGFQQEILDDIEAERRAGVDRHLVVAATGTGKTMIAAFDYHRCARGSGGAAAHPSLLFVAHREEILRQSLATFRQVLRDQGFGDLLVGGYAPARDRHLFCSVQSWHARGLQRLDPGHFDYVVLDEAHHAAAESYQAILEHVRPRVLLGLTATPERLDGRDIRDDFGGRFTHEIRLPDAVDRRLLSPFHYFGIADHDSVDLTHAGWQRGGYRLSELARVFGANEARAKWVLGQAKDYVNDIHSVRGLGFCVSREHARYMAQMFNHWGVPSGFLTAESPRSDRLRLQRDLVERRVNFIFTVDLYNEGVDIPEVDTILLLRPTESLAVYLQQLGRGLRLHDDKPHLTVLDFIAPQNRRFRYADRFRAMSGRPDRRIDEQVATGFSWLPSGCLVSLDRIATERVLANIRENLGIRRSSLVQQLALLRQRDAEPPSLTLMLDWLHFDEPDDLLRHGLPCRLLEAAGGPSCRELAPYERGLQLGLRQLAACNDVMLLSGLRARLGPGPEAPLARLPADERERLVLAHRLLWGRERPGAGDLAALDTFTRAQAGLRRDLKELVDYRLSHTAPASGIRFRSRTGVLELHAAYTREQILLALGKGSIEAPHSHREGVLHLPSRRIDALFVTIDKAEAEFSPSTMYEDFAITETLFHWQSQSTVGPASPTGERYVRHGEKGYTPMLFLRPAKRLESGLTAPFHFCGPLHYVRHEGSHPMSLVWRLEHPLPARLFRFSHRNVA